MYHQIMEVYAASLYEINVVDAYYLTAAGFWYLFSGMLGELSKFLISTQFFLVHCPYIKVFSSACWLGIF